MYRKILFCTDLYPGSDYAFAAALDLAENCAAELIILHVLESRHRYSGQLITSNGEVWGSEEVFDRLRQKLRDYYFMRVESEQPDFIKVTVRGGVPWLEILRVARQEKVDLIVMGPYTVRGSILEFVSNTPQLGTTAQQVSLRARCPVSIITSPRQRKALEDAEIQTE
jgi:nucleotide-binding universal stress UspA family protein